MISKHITMAEATNSETAKKLGISNLPNDVELANMKLVAEKCFEPIREWYGKPLRINSFFRSAKLNSSIGGSSGTSQQEIENKRLDVLRLMENRLTQITNETTNRL